MTQRERFRPNQSARELREDYLRTAPADRLREVARLSGFLTRLAAAGIAGRDDLVTMKTAAGRPQDLIDITALRMAEGLEE